MRTALIGTYGEEGILRRGGGQRRPGSRKKPSGRDPRAGQVRLGRGAGGQTRKEAGLHLAQFSDAFKLSSRRAHGVFLFTRHYDDAVKK